MPGSVCGATAGLGARRTPATGVVIRGFTAGLGTTFVRGPVTGLTSGAATAGDGTGGVTSGGVTSGGDKAFVPGLATLFAPGTVPAPANGFVVIPVMPGVATPPGVATAAPGMLAAGGVTAAGGLGMFGMGGLTPAAVGRPGIAGAVATFGPDAAASEVAGVMPAGNPAGFAGCAAAAAVPAAGPPPAPGPAGLAKPGICASQTVMGSGGGGVCDKLCSRQQQSRCM